VLGVRCWDGGFRCFDCVDFSSHVRDADGRDVKARCQYCRGPVFILAVEPREVPKRTVPVALGKSCAEMPEVSARVRNLRTRLNELSFAYDKARQRIAELEARLAECEDAGFVWPLDS